MTWRSGYCRWYPNPQSPTPSTAALQILLLLLGVFACSTAVIFIKLSHVDPVLLTAFRLLIAAVVLAPLFARDWRRHRAVLSWGHLRDSAIPGVMLALHFVTWIIGARLTPAVNSSLIVNVLPIVMPLFLWIGIRERLTRTEALATLVATAGMAVLMIADYQLHEAYFRGDLMCLLSMLLFGVYLTLARRYRHHPTVWLYLVPLYVAGALTALAFAPVLARWDPIDWRAELPWIFALGLIPTVVGHSLLNNAMRELRGQVVSLVNMSQFLFAGLMAYPLLGEIPEPSFYFASAAVVVAGVMVAVRRNEPLPSKPLLPEHHRVGR